MADVSVISMQPQGNSVGFGYTAGTKSRLDSVMDKVKDGARDARSELERIASAGVRFANDFSSNQKGHVDEVIALSLTSLGLAAATFYYNFTHIIHNQVAAGIMYSSSSVLAAAGLGGVVYYLSTHLGRHSDSF